MTDEVGGPATPSILRDRPTDGTKRVHRLERRWIRRRTVGQRTRELTPSNVLENATASRDADVTKANAQGSLGTALESSSEHSESSPSWIYATPGGIEVVDGTGSRVGRAPQSNAYVTSHRVEYLEWEDCEF